MRIDEATLRALRDPAIVETRERHFEWLESFYARRIARRPFFLSGVGVMRNDSPRDSSWESWLPGALETLARERLPHARNERIFRLLNLCWDPHGVHFVDELFGARVFRLDTGWQAQTLASPIGELAAPDLERCASWREVRRFTERFLELEIDAVTLALPTLSSPLNIAINLYGDRIILAMMVEPEAARRDLRAITDTIARLHRWYIAAVPFARMQPIAAGARTALRGMGQICGCSTQLLSPRLYDEFIRPLDEEILALWPRGGMIHLCGAHAHHIPALEAMAPLRAVQMNHRAADDVAEYHRRLRDDQILYVNIYDKMPLERILEHTRGGDRTVIVVPPGEMRQTMEKWESLGPCNSDS